MIINDKIVRCDKRAEHQEETPEGRKLWYQLQSFDDMAVIELWDLDKTERSYAFTSVRESDVKGRPLDPQDLRSVNPKLFRSHFLIDPLPTDATLFYLTVFNGSNEEMTLSWRYEPSTGNFHDLRSVDAVDK